MDKTYEVICRTYTEDGVFMNSTEITVTVPAGIASGPEENLIDFLKEEAAEEMDERCCEDDGEAYWELSEWAELG